MPKFVPYLSDTALTMASPEFIITFAVTESEMPKPKTIVPAATSASLTG